MPCPVSKRRSSTRLIRAPIFLGLNPIWAVSVMAPSARLWPPLPYALSPAPGTSPRVDELLPPLPHPGGHIDSYRRPRCWNGLRNGAALRAALEHAEIAVRNEP